MLTHTSCERTGRLVAFGVAAMLGMACVAPRAEAQVGSGWSQVSFSKCAHYGGSWGGHYSNSGGVETFWISGTEQRSEIMICSPKWTSGRWQFEGEVNTRAGSGGDGGSSVQQVFGIADRNSDAFQLRVTTADGGSYRTQTDNNPAKVVATGVYGVYRRVNVIHDANNNRLYCYMNGSLQFTGVDGGDATHYFKYGIYMRAETNPQAQWRNVKVFSGGTIGTSPTPTPTPTPTPGAGFSGYYKILNRNSGKAAVVAGISTADGADVYQWDYNDNSSDNDEWEMVSVGSGYYRLMARHSGKAMVVANASTADGGDVIQYTYGGTTTNDEWAPVSVGSGYYKLVNRHSGKVLQVNASSTVNTGNINQWSDTGGAQKEWQLVSIP